MMNKDGNINDENNEFKNILMIPSNILGIYHSTFKYDYVLKDIKLPNNIIKLGYSCFENCSKLMNVDLSACTKMTELPALGFRNCTSLTNIIFSSSLTILGEECFENCGISKIDLMNIKRIRDNCFYECEKLEMITSSKLEQLDKECFRYCCQLSKIELSNIKVIKDKCFSDNMTSFKFVQSAKHLSLITLIFDNSILLN